MEIRIENLAKKYADSLLSSANSKLALSGLNLHIKQGERVGLIGPNGAGKSTLLGILAGTMVPSEGSVIVQGKVSAVLTLGVCLREELTGLDNIKLDADLKGVQGGDQAQFIEAVSSFSDLGVALLRPVRTYSTGMKSRLAFSMITEIKPEILLIDETLSAGDAFFADKASRRLKEICDSGGIVVIVSHNMDSVLQMTSRCIWLDSGSIKMDGESSKVISSYLAATYHRPNSEFKDSRQTDGLSLSLPGDRVRAGSEFAIQVSGRLGSARLSLFRLDGILISEITTELNSQVNTIRLSNLPLAKGFYCLECAATTFEISARLIFEVWDANPPKGATPLLKVPAPELTWVGERSENASV